MSPFVQTPIRVAYPSLTTDTWVVISKLSELPLRVVPSLGYVNHASEFALPFPTGRVPYKATTRTISVQQYNDVGQPLYDDGNGGTINETDGNGVPYPPLMGDISEDQLVSLRDFPSLFTLEEVKLACVQDFLVAFPFYDQGQLFLFDGRYDGTATYAGQQGVSGLASGSHPFFVGPIQGTFDTATTPRGHALLIAPTIEGTSWFFQIRHGIAGTSGFTGPIADISMASRAQGNSPAPFQELTPITPMVNLPLSPVFLTDAAGVEVSHFWIRSIVSDLLQIPYPIVPFIMVLLKSTGAVGA